MTQLTFQTDNGSEFVGCFRQDRTRDGFEKEVAAFHSRHRGIPPGQWSFNSDVETIHAGDTVEATRQEAQISLDMARAAG